MGSPFSSLKPSRTLRTLERIRGKHWWPCMAQNVNQNVASCGTCAQAKVLQHHPAGKLVLLITPQRPQSHIATNFIMDLPTSEGYTTILVVVDRFLQGIKLIPLPTLPKEFTMPEKLFQQVFRYWGIPKDIICDRGPQFISEPHGSLLS